VTDIRRVADPITKKYYYPQTHYLAVLGLTEFVRNLVNNNYVNYVEDLKSINTSGLFYFDQDTKNKPVSIQSGYLQAYFRNSANGVIEVKTTNYYFEVIDSQLSDLKERS